ncbi:MAG: HAMP domain-containing sensor histidine kinase [Thiohalomonadaceae bacterium]
MNSLFTKIFLAFWLAAVLLGFTLFGVSRLFGGEVIVEAQRALEGKAATAAALWQEGGMMAAARWLRSQPENLRLQLLDERGEPVLRPRLPRHPQITRWPRLPQIITPGVHPAGRGRVLLAAALPHVEPPAFLVQELEPGRLPLTPWWLRLLIAASVTGLVSYGLAALLTRRLRRLRRAVQALAAGDLSVRVGRSGGDEVEALARDFDQMTDHLRDLLDAQKRLLRDVSHELRSPLARLRIALELAERDKEKSLQRIAKEADELEALIADVLSLARLESGQSVLERSEVALHALIQQIVTDADFEAAARGCGVELGANDVATLAGDPVLLRSAIENVVRNAVRHTAPGTTVMVELHSTNNAAVITVRDHGGGVPEEALSRLFEPFTRVDEARERAGGGYGLGLAITSRAVQAHGGSVSAENHPEGGLLVSLRLPLCPSPALPVTWGGPGRDMQRDERTGQRVSLP